MLKIMKEKMIPERWNYRFMTLKLLEKDESIIIFLDDYFKKKDWEIINEKVKKIENIPQRNSEFIISSIRHNMAFQIFENVAKVERSIKKDVRDKLDNLFMHPFLGYVFLISILYMTFWLIFTTGGICEPLFLDNFEKLSKLLSTKFADIPFLLSFLRGFVQGIGGGIGIAIPFLLPFFIMLSLLEDTGYLARVAYLIDNLMHKIGLHGMSVVPIILGYGCTVPGILATRILKSPRDKFITATLTTMVPCSARMTIIFGLVGFFISIKAAILIYIINIIILGFTGKLMSKAMPEVSPGLILEIPKYHLPGIKALFNKTWFRLKEFVYIAWPLLIIGSIILELIELFDLTNSINSFLSPFTSGILGLPAVVGVTLIFGIMRKELALILLFSALKTKEVLTVMTPAQIYSFTIFATFYVPCIATIAVLARELNWKKAGLITGLTFIIAIILAVLVRFIFPIFT
jgi:ferrous iron transport protein B